MPDVKDVFICHASEDKHSIVRPLTQVLSKAGISFWFDEAEIKWGDSISERVNDGLRSSKFVIVILSEAFLLKNWPQRELNSSLNIEASSGEVRVLPLLYGSAETIQRIMNTYPILNDKLYLTWDHGPEVIVKALISCLGNSGTNPLQANGSAGKVIMTIPMPSIKRTFTQKEKDVFLKDSFGVIRTYFVSGLSQLESKHPDIETDFTEVNNFKFTCTIYLRGKTANKCKIWIGGILSSNSISYREGDFGFDEDNSCNDWLTVNDEGPQISLKVSGMSFGSPGGVERDSILSPEKAAEYLWTRFTDRLRY